MWIFFWRKYAFSKLATFVSFVGMMMRYVGVACLFESLIPGGLICIAIGIGIHFGAEAIAKNKEAKAVGEKGTAKTEKSAPAETKATVTRSAPKSAKSTPVPPAVEQTADACYRKIKCRKCGALVSVGNKFCTECGNILIVEVPKQKKCIRCGELIDSGSKFCGQCGYVIK
ncbi:MAG: zinc ribbon domain-containing protein [Clostridia bacterium]|nr:zinc ribbon domain-containing protein [Clostridia bacterium]